MESRIIKPIFIRHYYYPEIIHLNPRFDPGGKLLRATLLIDWEEARKREKIEKLLQRVAGISSTLHNHQCSGDGDYLPFLKEGQQDKQEKPEDRVGSGSFDGDVALAHLTEHLTIDFLCFITERKKCSGVTCAFQEPANKFDLFVESADPLPGVFSFSLAVSVVEGLLLGRSSEDYFRSILEASRYCFLRRYDPVWPADVSMSFRWEGSKTENILEAISAAGFLDREGDSLNFSGVPVYRLSRRSGNFFRLFPPT